MATPRFFKGLRRLAANHGIPFIVDETKSGMGQTGKNWGHDHWWLSEEETPDFVTFGGKSGVSGFFSTIQHRLNQEATSFQQ
jgi:4-aminobutyrate aminotransferase-like enzyme